MSLRDLKEEVTKLSVNERLVLISWIAESIQTPSQASDWQFLESRSDTWREQLYMKGRKLPASIVWSDMVANKMTIDQAVENWDLSSAAIQEAIRYCESHRELIAREAKIDREEAFSDETVHSVTGEAPVETSFPQERNTVSVERKAISSNQEVLP